MTDRCQYCWETITLDTDGVWLDSHDNVVCYLPPPNLNGHTQGLHYPHTHGPHCPKGVRK